MGVTFAASWRKIAVTPKVSPFGISVLAEHIIKAEPPIYYIMRNCIPCDIHHATPMLSIDLYTRAHQYSAVSSILMH